MGLGSGWRMDASASGGAVTGSGTAGKLVKWTGAHTVADSSYVSETSGKVNITSADLNIVTSSKGLTFNTADASVSYASSLLSILSSADIRIGSGVSNTIRLYNASGNVIMDTGAVQFPFLLNSRATYIDVSGNIQSSVTTDTELSYSHGVTSNIQTQLDSKATSTLATNKIFIGSAGNLAVAQTMGGDATIVANGTLTLANTAVSAASYVLSSLTVDSKGRLTSASSAVLASTNFWVGNGLNVPTAVAMSGDATLANTGAITLSNTTVGAGSYTYTSLTVDSKGRITAASSGVAPTTYTFSTGLTNTANTITSNLSTGITGGQSIIGGTDVADKLTYKGTTGNGTAGVAAHVFVVGNNGASTAMTIYNNTDIQTTGTLLLGASAADTTARAHIDFNGKTYGLYITGGTYAIKLNDKYVGNVANQLYFTGTGEVIVNGTAVNLADQKFAVFGGAYVGGDIQMTGALKSSNGLELWIDRDGDSSTDTCIWTHDVARTVLMTLNESGNLGIGIAPTVRFQVHTPNTNTTSTIKFTNASTTIFEVLADGTTRIAGSASIGNATATTLQARIGTASGYVEIGQRIGSSQAAIYLMQSSPSASNYALASNGGDTQLNTDTGNSILFRIGATTKYTMTATGFFIGGTTTPTAWIHLAAGTATASTAPLKFTSGVNLTTAEAGVMEYNGTDLFFTKSGTTRGTVLVATAVTTEVVVSDTTLTVTVAGTTYKVLARA